MSSSALSNSQFWTEQNMIRQGNEDALTSSRGLQNLTSNVYRPSFSSDYTSVRSFKSPATSRPQEQEEEE